MYIDISSLFCNVEPLISVFLCNFVCPSFRTRPARLVEGHLRLTLHSSLAGLGPLHAVLSKRRGKVVTDAMVDGTDLIRITATIPQAESFVSSGCCDSIRDSDTSSSHDLSFTMTGSGT